MMERSPPKRRGPRPKRRVSAAKRERSPVAEPEGVGAPHRESEPHRGGGPPSLTEGGPLSLTEGGPLSLIEGGPPSLIEGGPRCSAARRGRSRGLIEEGAPLPHRGGGVRPSPGGAESLHSGCEVDAPAAGEEDETTGWTPSTAPIQHTAADSAMAYPMPGVGEEGVTPRL
ncbi:unnamed protein product [Boreogadus saida]